MQQFRGTQHRWRFIPSSQAEFGKKKGQNHRPKRIQAWTKPFPEAGKSK